MGSTDLILEKVTYSDHVSDNKMHKFVGYFKP